MIKGFLNLPWFLWAGVALIVAVIYSFVWPGKNVTLTTGFRFFILRWGHALGIANIIALVGGLIYVLFIVKVFVVK